MNTKIKLLAAAIALSAAASASATTLTFDGLNNTYGDGNPLGANMTSDGQFLRYTESGYVLTLITSNAPSRSYGAHIGDGTSVADTFNWHDDGDNQIGAFVTLTKADGGAFDLLSFDYANQGTGLTASSGANSMFYMGNSAGSVASNFRNVTSVSFASSNYSNNQLDNLVLAAPAVPEPATWAMMLAGFGMIGFAARRRSSVKTSVRYA